MDTATAAPISLGAIEVRFLVDEHDSAGCATVFETRVPAGAMVPPPHSHDGFEETVYGLDGVFSFTVDGQSRDLEPGQALFIRRGQVHRFENRGTIDATFLSVATPGVFTPAYFHEIAEVLAAATAGPPDLAALLDVMRRHGLTPALPGPSA